MAIFTRIGPKPGVAKVKVGDIFDLPENVIPQPGRRGNIRGQDGKALVGRYEVVELDGKVMGRVIVTYGIP